MSAAPKLPRELVWEGAHLSELALVCIADGQEGIVDAVATAHAEACELCAGTVGRAALLSEAVGHALLRAGPTAAGARARSTPRPWRALAAGMLVSVLAGLPAVAHLERWIDGARVFCVRGVPVIARDGFALATREPVSGALPVATLAASALLVLMGLAIARARSRSVERSTS